MSNDSMIFDWCKVRYTGDLAKNALSLANMGIGYVVLSAGKEGGEQFALVAYKQPSDRPMPHNAELLTQYELDRVLKRSSVN